MRIVAICGMPGCGKGELTEIAKVQGIPVFSMGDVVRYHFQQYQPDQDPIGTGIYADMERKKHGQDIWARRLVHVVEAGIGPDNELVLIDGLRSVNEKELFRTRWGEEFMVLALHSSPRVRFERLKLRKRSDDPADRRTFDQRDKRELGWGIGEVIAMADIVLVNEDGLEDLREQARRFLEGRGMG
ncbi:MAG: AAA family ATPase [Candidatus Thermoplasmatota archaeon]|nr:AAA family ATPase [Candidatus Thermoplasmatota archaeon]